VRNTESLNVLRTISALLSAILEECPVPIPVNSLSRDLAVLNRRIEAEGLPFVLVRLAALGKAVDRALETGALEHVPGFGLAHCSTLPAFLQDVLRYVFCDDGTLVPVTSDCSEIVGRALRHIRTVCFFAYKLDVGQQWDEEVVETSFVLTDESLPEELVIGPTLSRAAEEAALLLGDVPPVEEFTPRHGPGAVAGGETDEQKWNFAVLPVKSVTRGFGSLFRVNQNHGWSEEMWATEDVQTSRVAFVPKDARGPRVIAIEPKELQWLQQAIRGVIVPRLQERTHRRINFDDQSVNQRLALSSSRNRFYATLDMKDASDRVSVALARAILPPTWFQLIDATRSERTRLPSGKLVQLRKLSSMGSATTFPVEALVFWAISVSAIAQVLPEQSRWIREHVYVYGDDLIVPSAYATLVMDALEEYGLLVNRTKSFIKGYFRESCGVDAYHGENVTPVRMRKLPPQRRRDGEAVESYASLANRLDVFGYSAAAELVYSHLERMLGVLPYGTPDCGYIHRHAGVSPAGAFLLSRDTTRWRWNSSLQLVQMRVWAVEKRSRPTLLDGWSRLLRNLTMGCGQQPDRHTPTHGRVVLRQFWRAVTR